MSCLRAIYTDHSCSLEQCLQMFSFSDLMKTYTLVFSSRGLHSHLQADVHRMKFLIVYLLYKLPKLGDLKGLSWHG